MRRALLLCLLVCLSAAVHAGQASDTPEYQRLAGQWLSTPDQQPVATPFRPDFRYRFTTALTLSAEQPQILVFNGSQVWEQATVTLRQGDTILFQRQTGADIPGPPDFFLRNDLRLPALDGQFLLTVDYQSLFTIVAPEHQLWPEASYHGHLIAEKTLTLLCLGILVALLVQYGVLAISRHEGSAGYYAAFVALNLVFFANANLVLPHWLELHIFALNYQPLLCGNMLYILFACRLLKITRERDPLLWWLAAASLAFMLFSGLYALTEPTVSTEINRLNINLFLLFGLVSALWRTLQRSRVGALYLAANFCFVVFGLLSTLSDGVNNVQVEQLGLWGLTLEALILSLLITYKLRLAERERMRYLEQSAHAWQLAHRDALTGLANRLAFDSDLKHQQPGCQLVLLDMNKLKQCNDRYGHQKGDLYLKQFAQRLQHTFAEQAEIYRIGGDEFVLLCRQLAEPELHHRLQQLADTLRSDTPEHAGFSYGIARLTLAMTNSQWLAEADQKMYQHKHNGLQPVSSELPLVAQAQ